MKLYSVAEVAKKLDKGISTIRKYCPSLGAMKVGDQWVIPEKLIPKFRAIPDRPGRQQAKGKK